MPADSPSADSPSAERHGKDGRREESRAAVDGEPDARVKIAIGSHFEHIDLIQIVVDDALARLGLDEDSRHWVGIAVREGVANAIKHGNLQDPSKEVGVELAVEGEEAVIRIEDRGAGFDPESVGDPLAPENLLKPNGRGIFYMKSFMDDIQYSVRPGGGTVVTLRKRITAADQD